MDMTEEQVILVDSSDNELGLMAKMEAHRKGLLHRAFSICLFNDDGEMLIQKRSNLKYHSPGLWTNACCSHPRSGETVMEAANRRLKEELGIQANLEKAFSFIYKTRLDHDMIEHEYDHVLLGRFNGTPKVNPEEVASWKYMKIEAILNEMKLQPALWTEWFKIIMPKISLYYLPIIV